MPGCQSFSLGFLHNFVLAKLATSSIRVKNVRSSTSIRMYTRPKHLSRYTSSYIYIHISPLNLHLLIQHFFKSWSSIFVVKSP